MCIALHNEYNAMSGTSVITSVVVVNVRWWPHRPAESVRQRFGYGPGHAEVVTC